MLNDEVKRVIFQANRASPFLNHSLNVGREGNTSIFYPVIPPPSLPSEYSPESRRHLKICAAESGGNRASITWLVGMYTGTTN